MQWVIQKVPTATQHRHSDVAFTVLWCASCEHFAAIKSSPHKQRFKIIDGLSYLHNSVKMLHGNLTPSAIYVTTSRLWKIAGFAFSVSAKEPVCCCLKYLTQTPQLRLIQISCALKRLWRGRLEMKRKGWM